MSACRCYLRRGITSPWVNSVRIRSQHSLTWTGEQTGTSTQQDDGDNSAAILQPFQNDIKQIPRKNWRLLFKHIERLRNEESHGDAINIGQMIFSKESNINSIPREFYEQIFYTLSGHSITKENADFGLDIFEKYIEQEHLNESRAPALLEVLYRTIAKHNDPFMRFRYLKITQNTSSKLTTKSKKEALYERLIALYIGTGELEGAIDVMREAAQNGMGLPFHTNEKLMIALLENGDIDFAWEIVYKLHGQGTVFSRTWGLFISYAAKGYHYLPLEWAWKTAIIPGNVVLDDWCFLRIIEVGKRNGDYSMVRWAFLRYRQRILASGQSIPSTGKTLVPLIEAHALAEEVPPGLEVIERIGESASDISLRDIPEFLKLVTKSQTNFNLLEKKFYELKKNPRSVDAVKTLLYNMLLKVLSGVDMESALSLYRDGQFKFDVAPNEDTIVCIMKIARNQADVLLIDEIISDCKIAKIPLTRRILEPLVISLQERGSTDAAQYYLDLMKSLGIHPRAYLTN